MIDKSRLLWRCRRGIREMDIVFTDFVEQCYEQLNDTEKQDLDRLLDEADLDILNWVMGKEESEDAALQHVVDLIRQSRHID